MTNREWLFTLSNEQLADFMCCPTCACCIYRKDDECTFYHEKINVDGLNANTCRDRMVEWLGKENEEE